MSGLCGLDVGISTTDIVADWAPRRTLTFPTAEPVETATLAVRRLLETSPPPPGEPIVIAATGVGSHRLGRTLCSFPVRLVSEIEAIGRGGVDAARVDEALVVSLGTGTAMVSVRGAEFLHVTPGTGVGGGTLLALARSVLGLDDFETFAALAARGDRSKVDLTLRDVAGTGVGAMPAEATASNLGKLDPGARPEDVAAGIANLVTEVALTIAFLGLQITGHSRIVLIGKLALLEALCRRLADLPDGLRTLFNVPADAGTASARGALAALQASGGKP